MASHDMHLKGRILTMLRRQKLGVLATQGAEYPYATLVGYAFTADLTYVLFATMRHTRKYHNLKTNPAISILIDSRKNDAHDFKDAAALTVLGRSVRTTKALQTKHRRLYRERFPELDAFVDDPDTIVIALKVKRYIFVERFQQVWEMRMP